MLFVSTQYIFQRYLPQTLKLVAQKNEEKN